MNALYLLSTHQLIETRLSLTENMLGDKHTGCAVSYRNKEKIYNCWKWKIRPLAASFFQLRCVKADKITV